MPKNYHIIGRLHAVSGGLLDSDGEAEGASKVIPGQLERHKFTHRRHHFVDRPVRDQLREAMQQVPNQMQRRGNE